MKRPSIIAFRFLSITIFAISLSMIFHPDVRSSIRSLFLPQQRIVLSTATGVFDSTEGAFRLVKIRTQDGIYVEIYRAGLASELVDRIELPKHKDAFFTFNGQATNMAIDNIDSVAGLELLVPTFDSQLTAHLSVFKFNTDTRKFETIRPKSF